MQLDAQGKETCAALLPGYARGLSFHGGYAFVGLSKARQSSSFEGLPIAASGGALKCGVAAIELATGNIAGLLEFDAGIEEIFDVRVNPFSQSPQVEGLFWFNSRRVLHVHSSSIGMPLINRNATQIRVFSCHRCNPKLPKGYRWFKWQDT